MTRSTVESFMWTPEKIAEAICTWNCWPGFSGETCGLCKIKANVLAGGPGWICICGHYNVQAWHGHSMPHNCPSLGPAQHILNAAGNLLPAYWDAPCTVSDCTQRDNKCYICAGTKAKYGVILHLLNVPHIP